MTTVAEINAVIQTIGIHTFFNNLRRKIPFVEFYTGTGRHPYFLSFPVPTHEEPISKKGKRTRQEDQVHLEYMRFPFARAASIQQLLPQILDMIRDVATLYELTESQILRLASCELKTLMEALQELKSTSAKHSDMIRTFNLEELTPLVAH